MGSFPKKNERTSEKDDKGGKAGHNAGEERQSIDKSWERERRGFERASQN